MTPAEAAREIVVSIQACGAWPKQRESAVQLEKQIEDTLRRHGSQCWDQGYDAARSRYDWREEKAQ